MGAPITRASTVLRRAKQEIINRGWTTHSFMNQGGEVCALGALTLGAGAKVRHIGGSLPEVCPVDVPLKNIAAYDGALMAVYDQLPAYHMYSARNDGSTNSIPHWNDYQARNQENVLAVFDQAIAVVGAQEKAARLAATA